MTLVAMERRLRLILLAAWLSEREVEPALPELSDLDLIERIADAAVARHDESGADRWLGRFAYSSGDPAADCDAANLTASHAGRDLAEEWQVRRMSDCPACTLCLRTFVRIALRAGPLAPGRRAARE